MVKIKSTAEWQKQARYDLETAYGLFKIKRYTYSVFICHLSVEKMLKGLYAKRFEKEPPKIHSLVYFVKVLELSLPDPIKEFIEMLEEVSVPTRYPDELSKMKVVYSRERTRKILESTREVLTCLKENFRK